MIFLPALPVPVDVTRAFGNCGEFPAGALTSESDLGVVTASGRSTVPMITLTFGMVTSVTAPASVVWTAEYDQVSQFTSAENVYAPSVPTSP
jgi:hypothetical protein